MYYRLTRQMLAKIFVFVCTHPLVCVHVCVCVQHSNHLALHLSEILALMIKIRIQSKHETWKWKEDHVYRAVGRIVTADKKVMLLFDFSKAENWKQPLKKGKTNG